MTQQNENDVTIDLLEKEKTRCGCKKIDVYRTLTYWNILIDCAASSYAILTFFHGKQRFIELYGEEEGLKTYKFITIANVLLVPQYSFAFISFIFGLRWSICKRHSR